MTFTELCMFECVHAGCFLKALPDSGREFTPERDTPNLFLHNFFIFFYVATKTKMLLTKSLLLLMQQRSNSICFNKIIGCSCDAQTSLSNKMLKMLQFFLTEMLTDVWSKTWTKWNRLLICRLKLQEIYKRSQNEHYTGRIAHTTRKIHITVRSDFAVIWKTKQTFIGQKYAELSLIYESCIYENIFVFVFDNAQKDARKCLHRW